MLYCFTDPKSDLLLHECSTSAQQQKIKEKMKLFYIFHVAGVCECNRLSLVKFYSNQVSTLENKCFKKTFLIKVSIPLIQKETFLFSSMH